MEKDYLIPELIKDLVKKYEETKSLNEFYALEERLKEITKYVNATLNKKHKYIHVK